MSSHALDLALERPDRAEIAAYLQSVADYETRMHTVIMSQHDRDESAMGSYMSAQMLRDLIAPHL